MYVYSMRLTVIPLCIDVNAKYGKLSKPLHFARSLARVDEMNLEHLERQCAYAEPNALRIL